MRNRKRRTRCDRGRPCSECSKRHAECDYTEASAPPAQDYYNPISLTPASASQLMGESSQPYPSHLPPHGRGGARRIHQTTGGSSSSTPKHECFSEPSPSSRENCFPRLTSGLLHGRSSCSTEHHHPRQAELCSEHLPLRHQVDILSQCCFNNVTLWLPSVNPVDWKIQLDAFWNSSHRLHFRPSPSPSTSPPHLTQHFLVQFLAILYAILGHSLTLQADIHHLESTAEHLSSVGSSASNPPGGNHLWNLTQAEKISLSNRCIEFC
ncbi:hypothetical protein PCANC_08477 [Puccinia coronata f. sp. avenae]|uniref:Zn(2)-C6 fungal-type domain-containing protein n=1 Tax=Puccinia coronata f. sp. avenae TaxID=200324 RepID=A0A2N5T4C2_9BASI|nr:hypothetical protein PCANC_08477 [Puccinia coronata f. sp. avenae]